MKKLHSVLQPGLEKLLEDKAQLEKLIAGPGRYEQHRQGRKSIVLERNDLIKRLKDIKVMIKAQKKFNKKTDPAIQQRKLLRAELMQLPKSKLVDLYLNLRFDEVMIQNFHMPIYKRGVEYERGLLDHQKKTSKQRYDNNRDKVKKTLSSAKIIVTPKMTPGWIIARLNELNIPLPLSDKPLRQHLTEIIKSS
jgi:hypothetical protein